MNKVLKLALGVCVLMLGSNAASAQDWTVDAKVTMVNTTQMPNVLFFALDTNAGSCPARSYFSYDAHGDDAATKIHNMEANAALLMTAKSTGQTVRIAGNNLNCTAEIVYLGSVDRY